MSCFRFSKLRLWANIILILMTVQAFGRKSDWKFTNWKKDWKLELRSGGGMLLSRIPDVYLRRINDVNPPTHKMGTAQLFSIKKSMTPHIEIGNQLEYMNIKGNVMQDKVWYRVKTQALGNSFLCVYNFKRTDKYTPPTNYYIYYKIGGVSIKNIPREIVPEGQFPTKFITGINDKYIKNIAVLTGIGLGMNHQLSDKISVTAAFEVNRNSNNGADIIMPHKIFYNSSSSINNYISLTLGLNYKVSFSKQKKLGINGSRSDMDYKLFLYRKKVKREKSCRRKHSPWYN